jgi:arylsulfatase A-like enzyme
MKPLLLLLFAGMVVAPSPGAPAPSRPNVLLILADDLGYGDLSRSGHPQHRTPAIDRIAEEGVEFRQFTVVNPVCSPSRAATLTGVYPARLGVHQHFSYVETHRKNGMPDWLDPKVPNLARLLQRAGYATGHFGKWHLTNNTITDAPLPAAYGFDESRVWNGPGPRSHPHQVADHTIDFIRRHAARPWFVNLWLHEPHTPHHPTEESLRAFAHLGEQERIYAAILADADRTVAKVMAALKELRIDERTLVVFWSDNGPEKTGGPAAREMEGDNFGRGYGAYHSVGVTGGLRGRKRHLFEGGVRVPFFVRWPGRVPAGRIDDTSVLSVLDLLPTVCAAAGVTLPAGNTFDGENVLEAWGGRPIAARRQPIFWEWRGGGGPPDGWARLAIREGRWKLVLNADGTRAELYDVVADRAERTNLAAGHAELVARLKRAVLAWQATLPTEPPAHCLSSARSSPPAKK